LTRAATQRLRFNIDPHLHCKFEHSLSRIYSIQIVIYPWSGPHQSPPNYPQLLVRSASYCSTPWTSIGHNNLLAHDCSTSMPPTSSSDRNEIKKSKKQHRAAARANASSSSQSTPPTTTPASPSPLHDGTFLLHDVPEPHLINVDDTSP
jgi:hypothetical protein